MSKQCVRNVKIAQPNTVRQRWRQRQRPERRGFHYFLIEKTTSRSAAKTTALAGPKGE